MTRGQLKKHLFFSLSMTFTSFFLAFSSLMARKGEPWMMFGATLLMWSGYLVSHRIETGRFIDGKPVEDETREGKDSKVLPRGPDEVIGSLIGGAVFISGMLLGTYGLRQLNLAITFAAAVVFLTGYVIMHYAGTGELL
ncbi:MAG: hypothetical protein ABEJ07_01535 [Candidatus Nanohaloarchaea archaeon]